VVDAFRADAPDLRVSAARLSNFREGIVEIEQLAALECVATRRIAAAPVARALQLVGTSTLSGAVW